MLHSLFFVMSLSGSVVVILYWLAYPISRKDFSYSWRRTVLMIALFFYLFPLPLFKDFILSRLKGYFPLRFEIFDPDGIFLVDPNYTITMQPGQIFLGPGTILACIFALGMVVIACIVVSRQLKEYAAVYRTYSLESFTEAAPPQLMESFLQMKEELQIKREVKLVCSTLCDAPVAIGVYSPKIVFPCIEKPGLEPDDYKYILKHELLHIKNRDLLTKFLALLALALHWYNPLCHLLYYELCVVSELNCDYGVIKDIDDTQRQQYSRLILALATAGSGKREKFAVGLVNSDTAAFERRILEMKKARKSRRPFLSSMVMAIICILGTITAFSYEAPVQAESEDNWAEYDTIFLADHDPDAVEYLPFDYFFVDQDGNITPLDGIDPQVLCKHEFKEGVTVKHKKNSDGSCVTEKRSALSCSLCGYTKEGEIISKLEYTVCPH